MESHKNCYHYNYKKHETNCSLTGRYTDFFDIVIGIFPGGTLAPYMFIISQNYML